MNRFYILNNLFWKNILKSGSELVVMEQFPRSFYERRWIEVVSIIECEPVKESEKVPVLVVAWSGV